MSNELAGTLDLNRDHLEVIVQRVMHEVEGQIAKALIRHLYATFGTFIVAAFLFGGWLMIQNNRLDTMDEYGARGTQRRLGELEKAVGEFTSNQKTMGSNQRLIMRKLGIEVPSE